MATAVIVDAVRTPLGKRNGQLAGWHPADLAGKVLADLVRRNDLDPVLIEDVIMGCVIQVGEQTLNIGRHAVLAAGLPESVCATTVDRQCASSLQAVNFAAQGVMAGAYEVVVAAGVESTTRAPMGASMVPGLGAPFGPDMTARYAQAGGLVPQGVAAEAMADRWHLSRGDLDAYAVTSHQRAALATTEGRLAAETVPMKVRDAHGNETGEVMTRDEGVRPLTTPESLGRLTPSFRLGGSVTAGNSFQMADGAAAVLVMSQERAESLGLVPRARFRAFAMAGVSPVTMLGAPVPATTLVLDRANLTLEDIDRIEIHESFASVVLAWSRSLRPDMERVNVNGGAIALGHPLGCSGTRVVTTLVHQLNNSGGRYGLATVGEVGGTANALVIERLG